MRSDITTALRDSPPSFLLTPPWFIPSGHDRRLSSLPYTVPWLEEHPHLRGAVTPRSQLPNGYGVIRRFKARWANQGSDKAKTWRAEADRSRSTKPVGEIGSAFDDLSVAPNTRDREPVRTSRGSICSFACWFCRKRRGYALKLV